MDLGTLLSLFGNVVDLGSMLGSGWIESAFSKTMYAVWESFWGVLYSVWYWLAYLVDVLEDIFYVLSGIKEIAGGGIGKGEGAQIINTGTNVNEVGDPKSMDIVTTLINNPTVQSVFQNLMIIAIVLLMFFTVLQIIREQYLKKDGGNPYMTVFKMFKGMITMLFITAVVLVGLFTSGVVFKALNKATTGSESTGISGVIFQTMAYNANRLRLGQPLSTEWGNAENKTLWEKASRDYQVATAEDMNSVGMINKDSTRYSKSVMEDIIITPAISINGVSINYADKELTTPIPSVDVHKQFYVWGDPSPNVGEPSNLRYLPGAPVNGVSFVENAEKSGKVYRWTGGQISNNIHPFIKTENLPFNYVAGKQVKGFATAWTEWRDIIRGVDDYRKVLRGWDGRRGIESWSDNTAGSLKLRYDDFMRDFADHPIVGDILPTGDRKHVASFSIKYPELPKTSPANATSWGNTNSLNCLSVVRSFMNECDLSTVTVGGDNAVGKDINKAELVDVFFSVKPKDKNNQYLIEGGEFGSITYSISSAWKQNKAWGIFSQADKIQLGLTTNYSVNGTAYSATPFIFPAPIPNWTKDMESVSYNATENRWSINIIGGSVVGEAPLSYRNMAAVHKFYRYEKMNFFIGFVAMFIVTGVFLNFAIGLIQRLMELVILYIMSPITLAMYPFDDGGAFKSQFMQPFYKKVISVYAIILSLNLFFLLWPVFQRIQFFPSAANTTGTWEKVENFSKNLLMSMLMTIALLSMLPKIRNQIQSMLGADAVAEGSIKQAALDAKKQLDAGGMGLAAKGAYKLGQITRKTFDYGNPDEREAKRKEKWLKAHGLDDDKKGNAAYTEAMEKKKKRWLVGEDAKTNPMNWARAVSKAGSNTYGALKQTALGKALLDWDNGVLMQGAFGDFMKNTFDQKTIKARRKKLEDDAFARDDSVATGKVEVNKGFMLAGKDNDVITRKINELLGTKIADVSEITPEILENAKKAGYDAKKEINEAISKTTIEIRGGEGKVKADLLSTFGNQDQANAAFEALKRGGKTEDGKDFDFKGALGNVTEGFKKALDGNMDDLFNLQLEATARKDAEKYTETLKRSNLIKDSGDFEKIIEAVKTAMLNGDNSGLDAVSILGEAVTDNDKSRYGILNRSLFKITDQMGKKDENNHNIAERFAHARKDNEKVAEDWNRKSIKAKASETLQNDYDQAIAAERLLQRGGLSSNKINGTRKLYSNAYGTGAEIMVEEIMAGKIDANTIKSWGYKGDVSSQEKIKANALAIKTKYLDWAAEQVGRVMDSIDSTNFENNDISMKANQRRIPIRPVKIMEEQIKLQEQDMESINTQHWRTLVNSEMSHKMNLSRDFRGVAEQFRVALKHGPDHADVGDDIKNNDQIRQLLKSHDGRKTIELYIRGLSSMGTAQGVKSGELQLHADNISNMLFAHAFVDKYIQGLDGLKGQKGQNEAIAVQNLTRLSVQAKKFAEDMGEAGKEILAIFSKGQAAWYDPKNNATIEKELKKFSKQLNDKSLSRGELAQIERKIDLFNQIQNNMVTAQNESSEVDIVNTVSSMLENEFRGYFGRLFKMDQSGGDK